MSVIEQNEGVKVSVKDFLLRYVRYLPLFILSIILSLTVAYVYLRYAIPIFNARATILIKSSGNSLGGSSAGMESMFMLSGNNNVDNEIEILRSVTLAKRVVNALHLQVKQYAIGNIKTSRLYPIKTSPIKFEVLKLKDTINGLNLNLKILDSNQYILNDDNKTTYSFGQIMENGQAVFTISKNDSLFNFKHYQDYQLTLEPLESAAFGILNGLKITPVKDRADILLISYQGDQPQLGKDILNQLIEEYNESNIEDKNQITSKTISFINERLNLIVNELGDVEKDLQKYKQRNDVVNIETQSQIFLQNLSENEKQQANAEVKISIIKYLRDYIEKQGNEFSIVPSSLGVDDPTLNQLILHYNEIQLQRATQLKTTPEANPLIVSLDQQLEKLRIDLKENLQNVYNSAIILRNDVVNKSQKYKSSTTAVPMKEKQLLEITRQQGIKQTLYLFLLQKREEAAISLASTISSSKIVDSAIVGTVPIKPDPFNVKLLAVFLGLVLPLGFVYVRETLNDKVNDRSDIQKATNAPIFGEIGHSVHDQPLVVVMNSRNIISEQFRMIRSNMQYLVNKVEKPVILVTSTFSGEGKSFVSINVGAVMALAGKKTVILELDIRKPKIASGLKLDRKMGISGFLVGNTEISDLQMKVPGIENLYVIPCGPIPPNPSEILLEKKLSDLFEYAKENFDVVIVDTAPVGLVSDAFSLSKFADCTLYIVRLEYTLKKQIQFIDEIYRSDKLPKPVILVNDIKSGGHYYSYGNYSGYGYGSSSKNGYFEYGEQNGTNVLARWWRRAFKKRKRRKEEA